MAQEKIADVMKYEKLLPEDFNGTFEFTNWSDEDFDGLWGGVAYTFSANTTSPMVMPFSPIEIQNIRKKFAKDLAEREYFNSKEYKVLQKQEGTPGNRNFSSFQSAGQYSETDLVDSIKRALEPMEQAKASTRRVPKVSVEDTLSRDPGGKPLTAAMGPGDESALKKLAQGE